MQDLDTRVLDAARIGESMALKELLKSGDAAATLTDEEVRIC